MVRATGNTIHEMQSTPRLFVQASLVAMGSMWTCAGDVFVSWAEPNQIIVSKGPRELFMDNRRS